MDFDPFQWIVLRKAPFMLLYTKTSRVQGYRDTIVYFIYLSSPGSTTRSQAL